MDKGLMASQDCLQNLNKMNNTIGQEQLISTVELRLSTCLPYFINKITKGWETDYQGLVNRLPRLGNIKTHSVGRLGPLRGKVWSKHS